MYHFVPFNLFTLSIWALLIAINGVVIPSQTSINITMGKIVEPKKYPIIDLNEPTMSGQVLKETSSASPNVISSQPRLNSEVLKPGALIRAFYVLLGVTAILLVYLGYRMYKLRNGAPKTNVIVHKYGVLANRSDMEMLPLPLDEEDDDDTVFEMIQPVHIGR